MHRLEGVAYIITASYAKLRLTTKAHNESLLNMDSQLGMFVV